MEKKWNVFPKYIDVLDFVFLKTNKYKTIMYYTVCIVLLGIPVFFMELIPELKKYFYDFTDDELKADYIFLIMKDNKREVVKV